MLIVEDSEEMLWAVANVLEKAGFTVDAVTTGRRKEIRDSFLNAGAFAFLEKPFDIRELLKLCKEAQKRRNALSSIPPEN